ncbi:hypothetical protein ACHAPT_013572, partial [Fusarium lateritium]
LPTACLMNLGYSIARMILLQRALQEVDRNRSGTSTAPRESQKRTPGPGRNGDSAICPEIYDISGSWEGEDVAGLKKQVSLAAVAVLKNYVRISSASYGRLPDFYTISIGYAVLLLSKQNAMALNMTAREDALEALVQIQSACSSGRFPPQVGIAVDQAMATFRDHSPNPPGVLPSGQTCLEAGQQTRDSRDAGDERAQMHVDSMPMDLNSAVSLQTFFEGGYLDMSAWFDEGPE